MRRSSEAQLQAGEVLGQHQLVRLLARRQAVEIWQGQHISLHIPVALKILMRTQQEEEQYLRFERLLENEALILAELHHQHIIAFRDYLMGRNFRALVMEYASGGSLAEHHRVGRKLPLALVRRYTWQAGQALDALHQRGLLHRDVKPSNIFLLSTGHTVLADFGLAMYSSAFTNQWKTSTGGTSGYMAPEQQRGHPCSASDQYSLAVSAYEWLTGHRPFASATSSAMGASPLLPSVRLFRPELPVAIDEIMHRALHPNPSRRYATVLDFARIFVEVTRTTRPPLIRRLPYYRSTALPAVANFDHERPSRLLEAGEQRPQGMPAESA